MALVTTVKETHSTSTNIAASGTWVTDNFTPTNGSLLVAVLTGQQQNFSGTPMSEPSLSGGGLTWTKQGYQQYTVIPSGAIAGIWTAPVTIGASMAVTFTNNDTGRGFNNLAITIYEITGHDTASPVGGILFDKGGTRSGSYSTALSPATSATSVVLSGAVIDTDGGDFLTAGTGWTTDFTFTGDAYMENIHQRKVGATNAEYNEITTNWDWALAAIEIKQAPAIQYIGQCSSTGATLDTQGNSNTTNIVWWVTAALVCPGSGNQRVVDAGIFGGWASGSGSNSIRMAIYDSAGTTLIAQSDWGSLTASDAWASVSFSGVTLSGGTSYKVACYSKASPGIGTNFAGNKVSSYKITGINYDAGFPASLPASPDGTAQTNLYAFRLGVEPASGEQRMNIIFF